MDWIFVIKKHTKWKPGYMVCATYVQYVWAEGYVTTLTIRATNPKPIAYAEES